MISAFVRGIAVGPTVEQVGEQLIWFTEAEWQLFNLSISFIFGVVAPRLMGALDWELVPARRVTFD